MIAEDQLQQVEEAIGHRFQSRDALVHALTHASRVDSRAQSNERLEFLGDAILGSVVCIYLFESFGNLMEGELTKIKSSVVSRNICAQIAKEMGLDKFVIIGKGLSTRAHLPSSVAAAVYEAIIGAIYMDSGLDSARDFVLRTMAPHILRAAKCGHQFNFKSVLQQAAQQSFNQPPQYVLLDEQGPDHAKCFEICVTIGPRRFPSSWGASKKQAEQQAALEALCELGIVERGPNGEVLVVDESAMVGLIGEDDDSEE